MMKCKKHKVELKKRNIHYCDCEECKIKEYKSYCGKCKKEAKQTLARKNIQAKIKLDKLLKDNSDICSTNQYGITMSCGKKMTIFTLDEMEYGNWIAALMRANVVLEAGKRKTIK